MRLSQEQFDQERNQNISEWLGGREPFQGLAYVISENPDNMKGAGTNPEEGLVKEEALGGILYTGPMYLWYNNILRFLGRHQRRLPTRHHQGPGAGGDVCDDHPRH